MGLKGLARASASRIRAVLRRVWASVDRGDVGQLIGLGLVFWGLWLRDPWLAPLVVGSLVYLTHLFSADPRR